VFDVGDARSIRESEGTFDYVVSGLVINFVPEPGAAITEMMRVARKGGHVAAYVWDYADGMQMLRHFWDVAGEVDPSAASLDEGVRFPLCHADLLEGSWRGSGLVGVEVAPIEVPTVFSDFDDYWAPFLGGQGPAPTYISSLDEDTRGRIREHLRERLPTDRMGRIALTARAWAVNGKVA
jgi:SAM-dependent methyltransferase